MLAVAAGGVVGWLVAGEPVVATACVVAADLIGVAMMLPKTYRDPESETLATFALASWRGARGGRGRPASTRRCCSTRSTSASPTPRSPC